MIRKLRVGVLVDSDHVAAWAHGMLERVRDGGCADIVLVVRNGAAAPVRAPFARRLLRNWRGLAYLAWSRLDARARSSAPDPFARRDLHGLLPGVPWITVRPVRKAFSDYFAPEDVARVRAADLDVLIRLGFRILRGEALASARHGVWSYHHGDNRTHRGGPAGFWEVMEGRPATGSILQILTEDLDGGTVLSRSWSRTDPIRVARSKARLYWKSLPMLPRKLEQLHRLGEGEFFARAAAENRHPEFFSRPLRRKPGNLALAANVLRRCFLHLRGKAADLLYFHQWVLLYRFGGRDGFSGSFWSYAKITPPRDRFWADPFVVLENGKHHVFFEEFPYKTRKGHIACMTLDRDGRFSAPVSVLEKPYHLSYPFVFLHEGAYYMVPESSGNRTVELYRCESFPDRWVFVKNLMEGVQAVDATLLRHDGRWWLFANVREHEAASTLDELFLFHAPDLFADRWTPHPANPVVSDVRSARPAGRIFAHNGSLYRPSQDNGIRYGHGMKINRIEALTESEYRETCVNEIEPLWERGLLGTHTLNFAGGLTVIDALVRRSRAFG